jgi:hypothetical protein
MIRGDPDVSFDCHDCGADTSIRGIQEHYMVLEQTWRKVAKRNETLCIGCLEKRLGRRLKPADFWYYPVNYDGQFPQSQRLQSRIYGM